MVPLPSPSHAHAVQPACEILLPSPPPPHVPRGYECLQLLSNPPAKGVPGMPWGYHDLPLVKSPGQSGPHVPKGFVLPTTKGCSLQRKRVGH